MAMTKTQTIAALLLLKDHIEIHPDFYMVLQKLIVNDLYALMGDDYDIKRVEEEKPHIKMVLNDLAYLLSNGQIKQRHAKKILEKAWETDSFLWDMPKYVLDSSIFDEIDLESIIDEVIIEEAQAWEDFKSGKQKVIGRLVGAVMKKTQGKADPEEAANLFRNKY
jgi:aspartyl-tRNA(Asn)/glutamyl-tRNA(Gln) amidotransferase subunit B